MKPYKSYVKIEKMYHLHGWGICHIMIDSLFGMYMVESHLFFQENTSVPYDEFVDLSSNVPVYFFADAETAKDFCKVTSNRMPVDRQEYWLRFRSDMWFSTIANAYIDYLNYVKSYEYRESLRCSSQQRNQKRGTMETRTGSSKQ